MQSTKDEMKPEVNRESFMVLFDNDGIVSSDILKVEAEKFHLKNEENNCVRLIHTKN